MSKTEENIDRAFTYLDNVYKDAVQLGKNIQNLKDFSEYVETKNYKEDIVLQKVLSYVQYVSISELILTLDRLFEFPSDGRHPSPVECDRCGNQIQPKSGKKIFGQRSFVWHINQLREHSTSFNPNERFTSKELDEQLLWIESEEKNLAMVETYRDKWFAHRDKRYFDNPVKLWDDQPLELEVLESLVDLTKKIVEAHFSKLKDVAIGWNVEHLSEIKDIIYMKEQLLKYSEENIALHKRLRSCLEKI